MKKVVLSVLLLVGGIAIFVLGNPYYTVFPTNNNQFYCIALTLFFLMLAIGLKRSQSLTRYWRPAYALFIASAALLLLSTGVLNLHDRSMPDLQYLALDKLSQFLHVVPVIILLTLLVKDDLGSIFICKGDLKTGLIFGLASFVFFALLTILISANTNNFIHNLSSGFHWILLWVFANATMEELWFRGIFLNKYAPLVGRAASILVTSLVFGASHVNATYAFPGGGLVFGVVVFVLGVIGAYSMYRTDSLIGAVLFHAGYDLVIIDSVLNSM